MSARAIVSGVLFKAPIEKASKAGNPFATFPIRENHNGATRLQAAKGRRDRAEAAPSAPEPRPGRDIASKSWAAPARAGSVPVMPNDEIPFFPEWR